MSYFKTRSLAQSRSLWSSWNKAWGSQGWSWVQTRISVNMPSPWAGVYRGRQWREQTPVYRRDPSSLSFWTLSRGHPNLTYGQQLLGAVSQLQQACLPWLCASRKAGNHWPDFINLCSELEIPASKGNHLKSNSNLSPRELVSPSVFPIPGLSSI